MFQTYVKRVSVSLLIIICLTLNSIGVQAKPSRAKFGGISFEIPNGYKFNKSVSTKKVSQYERKGALIGIIRDDYLDGKVFKGYLDKGKVPKVKTRKTKVLGYKALTYTEKLSGYSRVNCCIIDNSDLKEVIEIFFYSKKKKYNKYANQLGSMLKTAEKVKGGKAFKYSVMSEQSFIEVLKKRDWTWKDSDSHLVKIYVTKIEKDTGSGWLDPDFHWVCHSSKGYKYHIDSDNKPSKGYLKIKFEPSGIIPCDGKPINQWFISGSYFNDPYAKA